MADGGGLYLEIMPTDSKLWRMKFKQATGKESRLAFGSYPDVPLIQAREKRDTARKLKVDGIDPGQDKKTKIALPAKKPHRRLKSWRGSGTPTDYRLGT